MRCTVDYENGFTSIMLDKNEGKVFEWKPEYIKETKKEDFIICDGKMNPLFLISENTPKKNQNTPLSFEMIRIGNKIVVPRFGTVEIEAIFKDEMAARYAGYTEPTHLYDLDFKVVGKSTGLNKMTFAAFKK